MKKVLLFAISALIIFGLTSCNKKAENLADLKKKYDGKEFADCDKYIEAAKEIIDIYIATVEKAAKGDENAKKEFEEFDAFMEQFDKQQEKFENECPEKLEALEEEISKKMEAILPQLMTLVLGDMDLGEDFSWDEEEVAVDEEMTEEVAEEIAE
jgi:hypothetical protein